MAESAEFTETTETTETTEPVPVQRYKRGMNPASRANLKLWQPGVAPNPTGAKGPLVTPRIRQMCALSPKAFAAFKPKTMAEKIAYAILSDAVSKGGERSREQILNRLDGALKSEPGNVDNRIQVLVRAFGGFDPARIE